MATANMDAQNAPVIGKSNIQLASDRMTPEALWAMGRISDYQVSPDGQSVVYQVGYYSVEQNKSHHVLYTMNIDGSNQQLLTTSAKSETDASWIDGGKKIAFLSGGQLWTMNADGTDRKQISRLERDIEGYSFSPDEKHVLTIESLPFTGSIEAKPADLPKTTGRVVNDLNYRHWDHYVESITHPFVYNISPLGELEGAGIDILEGEPYECPLAPFGGIEQLAWSPDSKTIAYTSRKKTGVAYAISTDSDIFIYNIGTRETKNLCKPEGYVEPAIDPTKSMANQPINHMPEDCNVGYDTNPKFSP
ncbi:MAG: peptidase S9, partial [Prevotellaceae bacterium]|nr:peptidase S9 [Prevotellaceae bacterium]